MKEKLLVAIITLFSSTLSAQNQKDCTTLPSYFPKIQEVRITAPNLSGDRLFVFKLPDNDNLIKFLTLPLPSFENEKFCETIKLSDRLTTQIYIPTLEERFGEFPNFKEALYGASSTDFPGGIVPIIKLGNPSAIRFPPKEKVTIFLIHGIRQKGGEDGDMKGLADSLRDPNYGLDPSRFVIDAGFDYGECTYNIGCSETCSIHGGGDKLYKYIGDKNLKGDFVLIGYSLGGLIARDMTINYFDAFYTTYPLNGMAGLITLGTPNLGYPYESRDGIFACGRLLKEMFGDYINLASTNPKDEQVDFYDNSGNVMALSKYLSNLNYMWTPARYYQMGMSPFWIAIGGGACSNEIRLTSLFSIPRGCLADTRNDGVVCDKSATFDINLPNGPSTRIVNNNYSHTKNIFLGAIFCETGFFDYSIPLYNPPKEDALIRYLKQVISVGNTKWPDNK